MKPASFLYHAPRTVAEALEILAENGDEAKPLAGGQSLVPILALRLARFAHLVDLNRIDQLTQVVPGPEELSVGAMTRQSTIERSEVAARTVPLLARAVPLIGHFQIRNRGTIGGSISHADPASELPAVAVALGAEIEVEGPRGRRRVPAQEFFVSIWETKIASDELCMAVHFPNAGARSGFAIEELAWRLGDFAIAGCAVALHLDEVGHVARAGVSFMGMGPTPIRAVEAEAAMAGAEISEGDLAELTELALRSATPSDDIHASAAYRRRVAATLFTNALRVALEEARHG